MGSEEQVKEVVRFHQCWGDGSCSILHPADTKGMVCSKGLTQVQMGLIRACKLWVTCGTFHTHRPTEHFPKIQGQSLAGSRGHPVGATIIEGKAELGSKH